MALEFEPDYLERIHNDGVEDLKQETDIKDYDDSVNDFSTGALPIILGNVIRSNRVYKDRN
ncbi:MAG: hypothetical protein AABW81_01190 [Nanoarchaeota archaeon]|mgnify:CR=1 FL=1